MVIIRCSSKWALEVKNRCTTVKFPKMMKKPTRIKLDHSCKHKSLTEDPARKNLSKMFQSLPEEQMAKRATKMNFSTTSHITASKTRRPQSSKNLSKKRKLQVVRLSRKLSAIIDNTTIRWMFMKTYSTRKKIIGCMKKPRRKLNLKIVLFSLASTKSPNKWP